jgi:hypothetical protein
MRSKDRRLKNNLDKLISEIVRREEKGVCYTCGKKDDWKYMHCGHYIKRGCWRLRYDRRNLHCQCPKCNTFMGGNMDSYAVHLIKDYGEGILEELQRLKNMPGKKWKIAELEQMVLEIKKRLKNYD